MRWIPPLLAVCSLVSLTSCAGTEAESSAELVRAERPDEPGSTRASREAAEPPRVPALGEDELASAAGAGPRVVARPAMTITPIAADEGEDGHGGVVRATRALAIDLDARRFPPRALDPVLHVGALRFTRYSHPRPGVLRYVVADGGLLPAGAEVAVQYGDDPSTRAVVTGALEVTW